MRLHERDDDDHAGEEHRNDRVGVSGEIEIEHWLPSFHWVRRSPPGESLAATESVTSASSARRCRPRSSCGRAGVRPGALHPHFELVHLAVEHLGREAEHVLAVQLLRDARERRPELVLLLQQEEAAAGFLRELARSRRSGLLRTRCDCRCSTRSRARSNRSSPLRARARSITAPAPLLARVVVAVGEHQHRLAPLGAVRADRCSDRPRRTAAWDSRSRGP